MSTGAEGCPLTTYITHTDLHEEAVHTRPHAAPNQALTFPAESLKQAARGPTQTSQSLVHSLTSITHRLTEYQDAEAEEEYQVSGEADRRELHQMRAQDFYFTAEKLETALRPDILKRNHAHTHPHKPLFHTHTHTHTLTPHEPPTDSPEYQDAEAEEEDQVSGEADRRELHQMRAQDFYFTAEKLETALRADTLKRNRYLHLGPGEDAALQLGNDNKGEGGEGGEGTKIPSKYVDSSMTFYLDHNYIYGQKRAIPANVIAQERWRVRRGGAEGKGESADGRK